MEIKLLDDYNVYIFGEQLGRGAYGAIYCIKNNTKVFKLFKNVSSVFISHDFMKEISSYNTLYLDVFANDILVDIVREKIGFTLIKYTTDLSKLLQKKLDMNVIKYILYILVFTLAKAQESFILHRDLKPSNILVSISDDIMHHITKVDIIDWGLSRFLYSKFIRNNFNYVQTLWYRAPEQIINLDTNNASLDMWSVGIIALELIRGSAGIFNCNKTCDQLQKYINTFYNSDNDDFIQACKKYEKNRKITLNYEKTKDLQLCDNEILNDFIMSCLNIDTKKRIDPITAINHKLFDEYEKPLIEMNLKNRISNINSLSINYESLIDNKLYILKREDLINSAIKIIAKLNWSLHELSRIIKILDKCMEYIYFFEYDIYHYLLVIIGLMYDDITCSSNYIDISSLAEYIEIANPTYIAIKKISKNILKCVSYNMFFKTFMMYDMLLQIMDDNVKKVYSSMCMNAIYDIKTLLYDDTIIFGSIVKKLKDKYGDKISTPYDFEYSDDLMNIL
jgi:mitogen-activated protein kinase 1/3